MRFCFLDELLSGHGYSSLSVVLSSWTLRPSSRFRSSVSRQRTSARRSTVSAFFPRLERAWIVEMPCARFLSCLTCCDISSIFFSVSESMGLPSVEGQIFKRFKVNACFFKFLEAPPPLTFHASDE